MLFNSKLRFLHCPKIDVTFFAPPYGDHYDTEVVPIGGIEHWGEMALIKNFYTWMETMLLKLQGAFYAFYWWHLLLADLKYTLNSLYDCDCKSVTHILYNLDHFLLSNFDQICFIECSRGTIFWFFGHN